MPAAWLPDTRLRACLLLRPVLGCLTALLACLDQSPVLGCLTACQPAYLPACGKACLPAWLPDCVCCMSLPACATAWMLVLSVCLLAAPAWLTVRVRTCVWMGDNYWWLRSNSLDSETGTETLRVLTNSSPPKLVFSRDVENKGRGQC